MNLGEILAGGQERRKKLDQTLGETLNYYLGPTGIPQRLAALGVLNPVNDMEQASQKAKTVFSPDATGRDRFDAGVGMVTDMATVLAPAAAANRVGGDATAAVVDSLLGIGSTTREGLQAAGRRFAGDEAGNIRVYHGSPHDFDRFSMDKIGTGEGAQAYGHGLYFAENEAVADVYSGIQGRASVDPIANVASKNMAALGDTADARKMTRMVFPNASAEDIERAFATAKNPPSGRMYEVNINANPDDFLDWDKPLGGQTGKPREALDDFLNWYAGPEGRQDIYDAGVELRDIQNHFDDLSPQQFAAAMRARGVAGSKYRDAMSRGRPGALGSDETRNYVVFDENLIEIVRKYGVAGAAAMLGMSAADVQAATGGQQSLGTLMANYDQDAEQRKLRDYLQQ